MLKTRLAIFVSGTGSNAMNIIEHFSDNQYVDIAFVLSNKSDSPVVDNCTKRNVTSIICTNDQAADGQFLLDICKEHSIDYIILAGYLRLIPLDLIQKYTERIINIHPALLPKYGGKGMYGDRVHQAVLDAKEHESGISIHFVDPHFDEGRLIAQVFCAIDESDTLSSLKKKVQRLEHAYFPIVIEKTIELKS